MSAEPIYGEEGWSDLTDLIYLVPYRSATNTERVIATNINNQTEYLVTQLNKARAEIKKADLESSESQVLADANELVRLRILVQAGNIYKRMLDEQTRAYWDEIGKQAEIALAILKSEPFMWLMAGSNHQDAQIEAIRPLWDAYRAAGGKNWGGN